MTLDEAMEELREALRLQSDATIAGVFANCHRVLAAYDAERAAKHEELAWQCGARFWCSDACEAKWREQNPSVHDAERAPKAKQCEPWCGTAIGEPSRGPRWCSPLCHAAGSPVNPKVTP